MIETEEGALWDLPGLTAVCSVPLTTWRSSSVSMEVKASPSLWHARQGARSLSVIRHHKRNNLVGAALMLVCPEQTLSFLRTKILFVATQLGFRKNPSREVPGFQSSHFLSCDNPYTQYAQGLLASAELPGLAVEVGAA